MASSTHDPPIWNPPDEDTVPWLEQQSGVVHSDERLVDAAGCAVMMRWEAPLMEAHAAFVCGATPSERRILNVGHGMGIVDDAISLRNPALHVICEAHPAVQQEAASFAARHPSTTIVCGRWQSPQVQVELASLGPFDGVFFDTYEETVEDFLELLLPPHSLLRPGARFSFCNMYQPFDAVRHVAYSLYLQSRLRLLGFSCSFEPIDIPVAADTWHGLNINYWPHETYLLPRCVLLDAPAPSGTADPAATGHGMAVKTAAAAETGTRAASEMGTCAASAAERGDGHASSVRPRALKRRRSAPACDEVGLPPLLDPLEPLLWQAKHWACRHAAHAAHRPRTDARGPLLAQVWAECAYLAEE